MKAKNEPEIQRILEKVSNCLTDSERLCMERHFKNQMKQSFVHGIMSGPDGNFEKYYEQKYNFFVKRDDHFGI